MFSSNQILKISCDLDVPRIEQALKTAFSFYDSLKAFEGGRTLCVYQITDDGRYALGWSSKNDIKSLKGWKKFDFDFDTELIARVIYQFLNKQTKEIGEADGLYDKGFLMKNIEESLGEIYDGVVEPFYGIVTFEPYTVYYSK